MKIQKFLLPIALLVSIGINVWYFSQNTKPCDGENDSAPACNVGSDVELHLLEPSTAATLSTNYLSTQKKLSDSFRRAQNFIPIGNAVVDSLLTDSRSAWFSYDEIAAYLCLVKSSYDKIDAKTLAGTKGRLGIRIYFGRYPANVDEMKTGGLDDLNDSYRGKHCLFFVPTYDSRPDRPYLHQDFDPEDENSLKLGGKILRVSDNKNHGALAPPESITGARYLEQQQHEGDPVTTD